MIQVLAYSQDSDTPTLLDISEESSVTLNMAFATPNEPMTRQSTYSSSFVMPDTKGNNAFFSHYYDANIAEGTFDTRARTRVLIMDEGAPVTEGVLQLLGYSKASRTFEVSIVGAAGDVFSQLSDIKLGEVFSTDHDVLPSASNVVDSWTLTNDITTGGVGAGVVVFPYADYGNASGGRLFYQEGVEDGIAKENYVMGYHFKPAMQVKHMIEKCIEHTGRTVSSTFLSTADFESLYMTYNTQATKPITRPLYGAKRKLASNIAVTTAGVLYNIPFTSTAGSLMYDPDGLMSTGDFVAPAAMEGVFEVSITFANSSATFDYADIVVTVGTTTVATEAVVVGASGSNPTFQVQANLALGEALQVHVYGDQNLTVTAGDTTYLRFIEYAVLSEGEPIDTKRAMPNVKASDFLREMAKRFNLAIIQDNDNPDEVLIEPLPDYILTGTTRDWTGKVDYSQPFNVKPTTSLKVKDLVYSDGVDEDYFNQWYNKRRGGSLGEHTYASEDFFADGEANTDSLCGSTGMFYIPKVDYNETDLADVAIPMYYGVKDDGVVEPVNHKPKLLFYNGLQSTSHTYYVGTTSHTSYPHFSPFTDRVVDADTWSVLWRDAYRFTSHVIGSTHATGLVRKYWSEYLTQIYSEEARLLECELVLGTSDIYELSFADTILIQNQRYRLIDLTGFNISQGGTASARLLKVIDDSTTYINFEADCDARIDTYNADGTTSWVDSSGASVSATEACCEAEGLTFSNSQCWWNYTSPSGTHSGTFSGPSMPGSIDSGDVINPPPLPPTTDLSGDDGSRLRMPYAGGHRGNTARTAFFNSAQEQHYLLQGYTTGTDTVALTFHGATNSGIVLPRNSIASIEVVTTGIDIAGSTDPLGDYVVSRDNYVLTHVTNGLVRQDTSANLYQYKSSGRPSHASVSISAVAGTGDYADLNSTLEFRVNGIANTITQWTAQVTLLVTDLNAVRTMQDAVVTEDFDPLLTENGMVCITEG